MAEPPPLDASPDQPVSVPPFASKEDLGWLNELSGQPEQQFTPPFVEPAAPAQDAPRQTAPLGKEEAEPPDWLKSAMETPAMPPPGDVSLDWFAGKDQPEEEKLAPAAGTNPPFSDIFATPGEPSPAASQDVDSLFSVEMPDWLSHAEPAGEEPVSRQAELPPAGSEDSLAPVDLPSWVQAMRPVEAVISEAATSGEEEPEETQGPLAGLRGVIPGMAIGSSMRPKSVSLKLQATNEQQASAALLEQILGNETNPRPLITSAFVASQQVLRWVLAGLFVIVLSAVIFLRSQTMQVYPDLPQGNDIVNALLGIPANARVLVVIDYEPSLAGEMEVTGGPLLDHMVQLGHPQLSFLSTSPNGTGLVERLIAKTNLAGEQYCNLGYLPGGSAGVLGYIESPGQIIPFACEETNVAALSDYAAFVVMTDHAESGRIWVEQLHVQKQRDLALAKKPLLVVASAQAGPLLQPYVSSSQITGMISGLADAARYEGKNALPPIVRPDWDAFGMS
jgi:hypothetical protein